MSNAADPKKIEEQTRRQKDALELKAADLRWLMSDERGRRIVGDLLDFCGPLRTPFDTNGSKANFNMGQQNVGLYLFARIEESCPDLYLVMKQESRKKED